MVVQTMKRGFDLCLEEVRNFRDWKFNFPVDKDCCIVPAPHLCEQSVFFTEKTRNDVYKKQVG